MKRRRHTRRGEGGGGKNQRQEQPSRSNMTRAARHQENASSAAASSSTLTDILLRPLIVECLTYLDQPSLRKVCLLSTVFFDIVCNDKGMENHRIIPLLEIRPSNNHEDCDEGRLVRLIQQLYHRRDKLQHYREVRIIDAHKFVCNYNNRDAVEEYGTKLQLNGVVSLICINSSSSPIGKIKLTYALAVLMPNLREANVWSCGIHELTKQCSRLEKLTLNNTQLFTFVSATGADMVHAKNLQELNIDNTSFVCNDQVEMSDLDNGEYSTIFLFHKCGSTVLERVSIKNATWYDIRTMTKPTVIPQNALIKFIRNAPLSLRYFGSNLSQENIEMLQSEEGGRGSGIVFG